MTSVMPTRAQGIPGNDSGWMNLSRVSHNSSLMFIKKDATCERGAVLKVDASSVTVTRFEKKDVTIQIGDLLQVGEGGPHNLVFNARSSWSDVIGAKPGHAEALSITKKDGTKYTGRPVSVSGTEITLKSLARTETLAKADIATIDYIRQKPLTDSEEYLLQEAPYLLLFSPKSYVVAMGLSPKLDVRLFDASKPEDNSKVGCNQGKSEPHLK
ncbi:hypothetical protein [Tunturiibacter gelidiferens]|uniref:Uncharacterized protein n=1 Tax=Tunturiibacter gelidiferens TaxID=3069689 RepID=A0AAU7Z392_9BACT